MMRTSSAIASCLDSQAMYGRGRQVFVDQTGRRKRFMRYLAGIGATCLCVLAVVAVGPLVSTGPGLEPRLAPEAPAQPTSAPQPSPSGSRTGGSHSAFVDQVRTANQSASPQATTTGASTSATATVDARQDSPSPTTPTPTSTVFQAGGPGNGQGNGIGNGIRNDNATTPTPRGPDS